MKHSTTHLASPVITSQAPAFIRVWIKRVFLKRAFQYGFATKILEVNSLLDSASKGLFCKRQSSYHCLFSILPVETPHDHTLRERGHNFVLPRCQNNIYKISFLNKCLFSIV